MRGEIDLTCLKHCMLQGLTLTLSFKDSQGETIKGADVVLRARTSDDAAAWRAALSEGIALGVQGRSSRKQSDPAQLAAFRGRSLSGARRSRGSSSARHHSRRGTIAAECMCQAHNSGVPGADASM